MEKMTSRNKRPTELVDMGKLMSLQGVQPLVLTQVAGPGRPRTIRVLPIGEMMLGRDEACDLVVDEDPVSRQHAKVHYVDARPELLDLGSTNGTFLNGKAIHRAFLKPGDRIQVGSTVFEVSAGRRERGAGPELSESRVRRLHSLLQKSREEPVPEDEPARFQTSAISGRLSEIRLASLLQIIESDQSTGTLVVLSGAKEGKLHVHQGAVRHATLGGARGPKALYRLMALDDGRFEFFIPGRSPEYQTIEGNLQKHLIEAMRQKDELGVYRQKLPPPGARLVFNADKMLTPARVPPAAFDVMASIGHEKTVSGVVEHCQLPDVDVCRILLVLLKHGVVVVEPDGASPSRF